MASSEQLHISIGEGRSQREVRPKLNFVHEKSILTLAHFAHIVNPLVNRHFLS